MNSFNYDLKSVEFFVLPVDLKICHDLILKFQHILTIQTVFILSVSKGYPSPILSLTLYVVPSTLTTSLEQRQPPMAARRLTDSKRLKRTQDISDSPVCLFSTDNKLSSL